MAEPLRRRCRHAGEGPECRRCPHGVPGHGQLLPQLNLLLRLLPLIACLRAMPPCPALVFEGRCAGTKSPRRSVRRGGSQTCDLPTHAGEGGMG